MWGILLMDMLVVHIQLKARDIIQKMGIPQGRLLKNVLLSLAQELIK